MLFKNGIKSKATNITKSWVTKISPEVIGDGSIWGSIECYICYIGKGDIRVTDMARDTHYYSSIAS
jgi:hypothetical protein